MQRIDNSQNNPKKGGVNLKNLYFLILKLAAKLQ